MAKKLYPMHPFEEVISNKYEAVMVASRRAKQINQQRVEKAERGEIDASVGEKATVKALDEMELTYEETGTVSKSKEPAPTRASAFVATSEPPARLRWFYEAKGEKKPAPPRATR